MANKPTGDWYYDSGRHQEDLERDLEGLQHRLMELREMPAANQAQIEGAEKAVESARANLKKLYGVGQDKAERRPAKAAEKR